MNEDSSQIGLPAVDDHALVRDGIAGLVGVRRTWLYLGSLTTQFWSAVDVSRKWFSCISKLPIVPR